MVDSFRKVDDAEICVGQVHWLYDPDNETNLRTTTCDQLFTGETTVLAYTEPEWPSGPFDGYIGVAAGVTKVPDQAGNYYLVAEPFDEAFRRGDAWRVATDIVTTVGDYSSHSGTYKKAFEVGGGMYLDEKHRTIVHPIVVSPYPSQSAGSLKEEGVVEPDRRKIEVLLRAWTTVPTINATLEMHWEGEPEPQTTGVDMQFDYLESNGRSAIYRRTIGIRRPGADEFTDQELDPGLAVIRFILAPGRGVLKTVLDGKDKPAVEQDVIFPVIEFVDDAPTYSEVTDPDSTDYDPSVVDSDNYFLREGLDHQDLDIYYRLLPESQAKELTPESVEFIFFEEDTTNLVGGTTLPGETDVDGLFTTGDELHVRWQGADDGSGQPREIGFYRVQMAVKYAGLDERITTPIDDGDPDGGEGAALGWQCPQQGLAIHDLVWKHRPELHVFVDGLGEFEPGVPGTISEFVLDSQLTRWVVDQSQPQPVIPFPSEPPPDQGLFFDLFKDGVPSVGKIDEDYTNEWGDPPKVRIETLTTDPGQYALYHSVSRNVETEDYLFLQYWMFENFSTRSHFLTGYPNVEHEGDLEYFQVAVRLLPSEGQVERAHWISPIAATASQHYYAQTLRWLAYEGGTADQAHDQAHVEHRSNGQPVIYVAQGSHATFFVEDAEICLSCNPLSAPRIGDNNVYKADCLCALWEYSFDRTAPSSPDGVPYQLIGLSNQSWLNQFGGRWGFLDRDDPDATGNGPSGPPHRSAKAPDGSPVNLRNEPCRLHNLAILRTIDEEVLVYECPTN